MHNCRELQERLTELVLDGIDARSDTIVAAELNNCAECRSEFNSVNATLRLTARLSETAVPTESFWNGYHERLRKRIEDSAKQSHAKTQRRKGNPAPFLATLRLCVRKTIPIPVPLIVLIIIAFTALSVFAIGSVRELKPQSPVIVHVPVEVPVPQEKIVTQVVYRDRRSQPRISKHPSTAPTGESTFARFKPTEDIKLTVIKGGLPNEK